MAVFIKKKKKENKYVEYNESWIPLLRKNSLFLIKFPDFSRDGNLHHKHIPKHYNCSLFVAVRNASFF